MPPRARLRAARRARASFAVRPPEWLGTATEAALDFPYLTLWGFPEKFHRKPRRSPRTECAASPPPPASSRAGTVVSSLDEFDQVRPGRRARLQDDEPRMGGAFTKIGGLVTDAGGAARIRPWWRASSAPRGRRRVQRDVDRIRPGSASGQRRDRRGRGLVIAAARPARPGQGRAARAHRSRRPTARRARIVGTPDRAGARHEPGARAGGAARPGAARPCGARAGSGCCVRRVLGARSCSRPSRCGRRWRRSPRAWRPRASREAELARLERCSRRMAQRARRAAMPLDQSHANAAFHATIVAAAGNATLERHGRCSSRSRART